MIEQGLIEQGLIEQGFIEQGFIEQGLIEQGLIEQLKLLIPANESTLKVSYAMLEQELKLSKKEIKANLRELVRQRKISIDGNCISIAGYQTKRCTIPEQIKKQVFAKFKNRCAYCGDRLTLDTRTIDHIVPLSKGGSNYITNFFPACTHCNTLKSSLSLRDFKVQLRVEMFYFEQLINTRLY